MWLIFKIFLELHELETRSQWQAPVTGYIW